MTALFKKTQKQTEAIKLLGSNARNVMLYGGSRSGKTFIIIYAMIVRACKTQSRHVALRLKFNHARTSLWMDTIPKVMRLCFPKLSVQRDNSNYMMKFPNGSELWVAGLDDKIRTEKILGKEYSTIFFNESSQIPFSSVNVAVTRLAEKNSLVKKLYYDENPPSKRHWSYSQFIQHKNPDDWTELNPEKYAAMLLNPEDNIDNIDADYITEILDELPSIQRNRFKYGIFDDADVGAIYHAFNRERNIKPLTLNPKLPLWIGMDFNLDPMTAVICQVTATQVLVVEEVYLRNSNTTKMAQYLREKYGVGHRIVPDSTGKRTQTSSAGKSDHQILRDHGFVIESSANPFRMDRYNSINAMFEKQRLWIDPRCRKLIQDLEQVAYKEGTNYPDDKDKLLTHISDALGYLVFKLFGIKAMPSELKGLPRF